MTEPSQPELECVCSPVSSREGLVHFQHQKHRGFYSMKTIRFFFLFNRENSKFLYWKRAEKEEPTGSKRVSPQRFPTSLCLYRQVPAFRLFQLIQCFQSCSNSPSVLWSSLYHLGPALVFPLRPISPSYKILSFYCLFLLKWIWS